MGKRVVGVGVLAAALVLAGCGGPQVRSAEELQVMLLTAEDLDPSLHFVAGDAGLDDTAGISALADCVHAPAAAADELRSIAGWMAGRSLHSEGSDEIQDVGLFELLLSDDPATLSAAVAAVGACPPAEGDAGEAATQLPVDAGDEAVVWRYSCGDDSGTWPCWWAVVRDGPVLMELSGQGDHDERALNDALLLEIVGTAAGKLNSGPGS